MFSFDSYEEGVEAAEICREIIRKSLSKKELILKEYGI